MKKGFSLLMIFCAVCAVTLLFSCSKNKSYTDLLKEERRAIKRLFDEKGFTELKDYPADGIFNENEFVQLKNGVYLHVIDSGNGNRPVGGLNPTIILSRAKGEFLTGDTILFDGFKSTDGSANWPLEFKYGGYVNADNDYYYLSQGYVSAMDFVGDSSFVSMIIPFRVGSNYQQQNYHAIYYEKVRFTFQK